ncbi:MAG: glycine cleavage system aminomethyltransferase GcvT [Candidatus Omnitrophota bacterium]
MSDSINKLKKTPLYEKHVKFGARMVPFAGWDMPVQYSGIIDEHIHTRTKAGLFDICHMGEFFVRGPLAEQEVDRLVTCRIDDMPCNKCRYGFLLNDAGVIIDDLIVFKLSHEEYMLVVNAGTIEKDKKWIREKIPGNMFTDVSGDTAKIDIQGPLSANVMEEFAGKEIIQNLKRFRFVCIAVQGVEILLSRTGYTGENGYELFFPAGEAEKIWDRFISVEGIKPIGLGARDTLRMEMGYSLYGSDIDEEHSPLEANLSKFVYMEKDFIGRDALLKQQDQGIKRVLAGFICESRRSARSHFKVLMGDKIIGEVTSAGFSPCLKQGIGLCYIDIEYNRPGQEITVTDGKVEIPAKVKSVPLYVR